jgi:hypothetical protein
VRCALIKVDFGATVARGRDGLDFADLHVDTAAAAVRAAIKAAVGGRGWTVRKRKGGGA